MYSTIMTIGLHGLETYPARVEVDCSRGLPGFEMVGFLGSEVKEARERIRVALKNARIDLPPLRITVNISPAGLHKEGTAYDLPVAAGIMVTQGLIPGENAENVMMAGELGLGGEVRPVRGILPMVLEARRQGFKHCVVPEENLAEAGMVDGIRAAGLRHLSRLPEILNSRDFPVPEKREARMQEEGPDFSEVRGQEGAKRAAMTAAAGFHHLLMSGPPGGGKTMIARCIPSILPPLTEEEQLEVASIFSVAGMLPAEGGLPEGRPFISPHHTVTGYALTGGGRIPKPGAISLAHRGVLFLDEMTEFRRSTLDLLRQPMEEHRIRIMRTGGTYCYPADFMLVAAMNPCPCGWYPDPNRCRCTPSQVQRYQSRISGPILDRIDISVKVAQVDYSGLMDNGQTGMSSARMRDRVTEARERQKMRYREDKIGCNAALSSGEIRRYCSLGEKEEQFLKKIYQNLQLGARSCHRLLRVARTLADLEGKERIETGHLSEAACYRMADAELGKGGGRT